MAVCPRRGRSRAGPNRERRLQDVAEVEPALIESVGWVLRETQQALTLAATWDDESPPHVEGHMVIPKGCIVRKRILR
jgi:hypothetical protein